MRALICERTPLSSRVSLRTSFSSFMLAIKFKCGILKIINMSSFSRLTAPPSPSRLFSVPLNPSATVLDPFPLSTFTKPNSTTFGTMMGSRAGLKKNLLGPPLGKKQFLRETEQRIFAEVIRLVSEIDGIRKSIQENHQAIGRLQEERPQIYQKLRYHGYSQRLTPQDCADLEQQNLELQKQINLLERQKPSSLQQILDIQREKYEELKFDLTVGGSSALISQKINQLRETVTSLEQQRQKTVRRSFPEFQELKDSNQVLRQKTRTALLGAEQQREMREYLIRDEEWRNKFLQELHNQKELYRRLQAENQQMKRRLMSIQSKENAFPNRYTNSSISSHSKNYNHRASRSDRLLEYQSFLSQMKV